MSDVLRTALAEETSATVTPPFARVVRLRRRRQAAQVIGVAATVLALVGGVALAVPSPRRAEPVPPAATPTPTPTPLRPFMMILSDPAAIDAVARCMRERGYTGDKEGFRLLGEDSFEYRSGYDACFHEQGYESMDDHKPRFDDHCAMNLPATRENEIARGTFAGRTWTSHVLRDPEGRVCVGYTYGRAGYQGMYTDDGSGRGGGSMDPLAPGAKDGAMLFYGSVPATVARIEVVAGGRTVSADTVVVERIAERRFYAFAVPYADGKEFAYERTDYAADGSVVTGPKRGSFPLH